MEKKMGFYVWPLILRGIVGILFGLMALLWVGLTLEVLVILFALYALFDGIMAIIASVMAAGKHKQWGLFLLEGILGITAGIIAIVLPELTIMIFVYLIAAWAILTGIVEFISAVAIPWEVGSRWLLAIAGILSVMLGILMFGYPISAVVVVVWLIGIYALVFGILLIVFGIKLKSIKS